MEVLGYAGRVLDKAVVGGGCSCIIVWTEVLRPVLKEGLRGMEQGIASREG